MVASKVAFLDPSRNCRLLYVVGQLRPGGLEQQLYYLLRSMDRERYRPALAVWNFGEEDAYVRPIRELEVPVYDLPAAPGPVARLAAFARLTRQIQPEVVHSCSFYTNFAAHWAVRGTAAIPFGAIRSDFVGDKAWSGFWLGRLSARWPRNQVCNSFAAETAIRRSRSFFVPGRLFVVRNGVDMERFRYVAPLQGRPLILGIGSLVPVKRWDRLLEAAQKLRLGGLNFTVRIVGDGPLREPLRQQATALGLAGCVEFLGYRADVPRLLAEATFLAHTSAGEGCPNAVMEAMASGRAVVATDVGDVPSLVEHGKTGFVVPREDSGNLVECLTTLITDHTLCLRMGEAGRLKMADQFGLDRLASETLAAYREAGWKDNSRR